jgi:16S rRNA processing protein RimM
MGSAPNSTFTTEDGRHAGRPDLVWNDMVVVGRVARTHGLRGHVVVTPDTDFMDERFAPGSALWMRPGVEPARAVVASSRVHGGRPVVSFEGVASVDEAAELVGRELRVPSNELHPLPAGAHYRHELVGCAVETTGGRAVGEVIQVDGGAAGSLLVVAGPSGEVLIPFASAICVDVDVERRRILVTPPEGLLELNEVTRRSKARRSRDVGVGLETRRSAPDA